MKKILENLTRDLLKSFSEETADVQHFDNSPLPDKNEIYQIIEDLRFLLFPGYFCETGVSFDTIEQQIGYRVAHVYERLKNQINKESLHSCKFPNPSCNHCQDASGLAAQSLISKLPDLRNILDEDVKAAFNNDPAASGFDEVIFSYPGLEAITVFRLAHVLVEHGMALIPRIMSEWAHSRTGVDIHPGATIGPGFFIDHGTGVVVGQTTEIGKNVTIYQGVTLGAVNFPRDSQGNLIRKTKRHPTIQDDVVIYAGATILGGNTIIGRGSVIGGNVWLTESVPPNSCVEIAKGELTIRPRHSAETKPGSAVNRQLDKI